MKNLTKVIMLVLALSLIVGTAYAWDRTDHVVMAPNGEGDLLIFPFWAATQGYQTNFIITNTSNVNSVVAKVVLRSEHYTIELLDFFIFLSPNDVFEATIRQTASGVIIESSDDSVISGVSGTNCAVWGNQTTMTRTLTVPNCEDTTELGYIEVFEAAYYPYTKNASGIVPKNTILCGFGGIAGLNDATTFQIEADARDAAEPNLDLTETDAALPTDCSCNGANVDAMYVGTLNVLAGHMEVGHPTVGISSGLRATTLRNYDTSRTTKLTIGAETTLDWIRTHNSAAELEAAMSKNELQMPYSSSTLSYHMITFPTKQTRVDNNCRATGWAGPYFNEVLTPLTDNCVDYEVQIYDMEENSDTTPGIIFSPFEQGQGAEFCAELNYNNPPNFPFDEGWVRYTFEVPADGQTDHCTRGEMGQTNVCNTPDIHYEGVPALGTVLDFGSMGQRMIGAAYRDKDVWVDAPTAEDPTVTETQIIYYYQYWDAAHYPSSEANHGYRMDAQDEDGDFLPELEGDLTRPAVNTTTEEPEAY